MSAFVSYLQQRTRLRNRFEKWIEIKTILVAESNDEKGLLRWGTPPKKMLA